MAEPVGSACPCVVLPCSAWATVGDGQEVSATAFGTQVTWRPVGDRWHPRGGCDSRPKHPHGLDRMARHREDHAGVPTVQSVFAYVRCADITP